MTVGGKNIQVEKPHHNIEEKKRMNKYVNIILYTPLFILIVSLLIGIYYSNRNNNKNNNEKQPIFSFELLCHFFTKGLLSFVHFFHNILENGIFTSSNIIRFMAKEDKRFENTTVSIIEYSNFFPNITEFNIYHLQTNEPFICKGCIKYWPAYQKWSSDKYLNEKIGEIEIQVEKRDDGVSTFAYFQKEYKEIHMKYSEFTQKYNNFNGTSERLYYANQPIPEPIQDDIIEPPIGQIMYLEKLNFWQSAGGSESLPHTDAFDNFLCQIAGYKDIVLVPPTQRSHLYLQEGVSNYSPINFFNPDLEKHPKFENVQGIMRVRLEAGDALFLPAFWWHHIISSKQRSIAVNYWYTPNYMFSMIFGGIETFQI